MERHVERLLKFQERVLPPPPMLDLDPIIPPYEKFGEEGHLYPRSWGQCLQGWVNHTAPQAHVLVRAWYRIIIYNLRFKKIKNYGTSMD